MDAVTIAVVSRDEAIRAAVLEVLQTRRYRERAERLRADVERLPGSEHAVELLEQLAGSHRPGQPTGVA